MDGGLCGDGRSPGSGPPVAACVFCAARGNDTKKVLGYLALYYGIAWAFAWIVWLPVVLGPDGLKLLKTEPSFPLFASIGTFGPCLAAFIAHRAETGNWKAVHFLPRGQRWVWIVIGPLLVLICYFFVCPALLTQGGPKAWHWHLAALAGIWVPMFNYNLFGGPLFEEFGWRGYLQSRLQRVLAPSLAAPCVGILWAIWHFPLFLVGWSSASPLDFVLILVGLSIVMATAFNASGESVLVAILMHSAFNASGRFMPAFLGNTPIRSHPSAEILLAVSFLIVGAAAILCTRGRASGWKLGVR